MPLKKGKGHLSENIKELIRGPQYQRTLRKFGKKKAQAQAVAVAYSAQRKRKKN